MRDHWDVVANRIDDLRQELAVVDIKLGEADADVDSGPEPNRVQEVLRAQQARVRNTASSLTAWARFSEALNQARAAQLVQFRAKVSIALSLAVLGALLVGAVQALSGGGLHNVAQVAVVLFGGATFVFAMAGCLLTLWADAVQQGATRRLLGHRLSELVDTARAEINDSRDLLNVVTE
ncbi:hypothetical protein TPB0596_10320 [Tsukamurella pulmonis]|uniref:hypothetical protein n=1 Tax=Tsukamurella pulmonis TaxID=47312 RepID=UPI001EDF7289|nr:hypothetical protein [Tsukamurella pulmonis]BDD81269.1 hypothetical protein TPB0596_10320 [Tsukamurella pulmonis]